MKTQLEAVAIATAIVLRKGNGKWAKDEAEAARKLVRDMQKAGDLSQEDADAAVDRLTGNYSQRRQSLERWGLIQTAESDSAEKRAILAAMEKLDKAEDAKLDAVVSGTPEKPKK